MTGCVCLSRVILSIVDMGKTLNDLIRGGSDLLQMYEIPIIDTESSIPAPAQSPRENDRFVMPYFSYYMYTRLLQYLKLTAPALPDSTSPQMSVTATTSMSFLPPVLPSSLISSKMKIGAHSGLS